MKGTETRPKTSECQESMSVQPGKALKHTTERRQRRYPRYRSQFPVTVTLFSGKEHHRLDAHCRDLSAAGIGILIAADLALGEVVSLNFCLPGQPLPWDVQAVIRHRRGYHYGFEFLSLPNRHGEVLAGYLPGLERVDGD